MSVVFSIVMSAITVMTPATVDKAMFCRDVVGGTLFNADTDECVKVIVTDDQAMFEVYQVNEVQDEIQSKRS